MLPIALVLAAALSTDLGALKRGLDNPATRADALGQIEARGEAARSLQKKVLPLLHDATVRDEAAAALVAIDADAAARALKDAVSARDGETCRALATAFDRAEPPAGTGAALVDALAVPLCRAAAVDAIEDLSPADTEALFRALHDPAADARVAALGALEEIAEEHAALVGTTDVRDHVVPLMAASELEVQLAVMSLLQELDPETLMPALPALTAALEAAHDDVRQGAAAALAHVGRPARASGPALRRLLARVTREGAEDPHLEQVVRGALQSVGGDRDDAQLAAEDDIFALTVRRLMPPGPLQLTIGQGAPNASLRERLQAAGYVLGQQPETARPVWATDSRVLGLGYVHWVAGDLAMVPVATYSFCGNDTGRSVVVAQVDGTWSVVRDDAPSPTGRVW